MQTSEWLDQAADNLERDGWYSLSTGQGSPGDNPTCVGNAIYNIDRADVDGWAKAQDALQSHIGTLGLGGIWNWNDHPDRTAAEVIEVLRACAVIEAAREEQDAAWATYSELVTA